VLVINLINYLGILSTPLGSSKFGIDAPILPPPFNALALEANKKWSYDST
jgi:hypothetical protein